MPMKLPWMLARWLRKRFALGLRPFRKRQRAEGPRLEPLEDRWLPAPMTFHVTDNSNASANSLRAAILASNANDPGAGMANTIDFAITGSATINLLSALPPITKAVSILGFTQPGSGAGSPL